MKNEFSRVYNIEELAEKGKPLRLEATGEERAALAKRLGLEDVSSFSATMNVVKEGPGLFEVEGAVEAEVVQTCVRTLVPVRAKVAENFATTYMEENVFAELDPEERDDQVEDIEVIEGEQVDLGELAAQYLSLGLDPYPVAEGVEIDAGGKKNVHIYSEVEFGVESSPFAKLKKLHKKG